MKILQYLVAAFMLLSASQTSAQEDKWEKWGPTAGLKSGGIIVRAGYNIGGTSPLPLPSEIRAIKAFSPKGGGSIGIDVYRMLSKRWGISGGCHFFYEGFHTKAEVKNYWMELKRDGNIMAGYFTGMDVTNTDMWGVSFPLLATFRMSPRWNVSFGPYFSTFFSKHFSGEVYDNSQGVSYIRVDTPIGEKVNIDRGNPATYDFSEDMRPWNGGVELGFDWKAMQHMNVFAKLDWGLSNIWESDFNTVSFKMYPIYGTIGVAYRY